MTRYSRKLRVLQSEWGLNQRIQARFTGTPSAMTNRPHGDIERPTGQHAVGQQHHRGDDTDGNNGYNGVTASSATLGMYRRGCDRATERKNTPSARIICNTRAP